MSNTIEIIIKLTDKVSSGIGGLQSKLASFGKAAAIGIGVATAAIVAMGAALYKLAVGPAIAVESAFAGVIKTTDGLADEFGNLTALGEEMKDGFRDMSREVPTAVEELMKIGELGGQLGIAQENLLGFTETIAAMGVTTDLTTEEAAVGFARIANVMGTAQEKFENMGSSVVALGNSFATTEPEIVEFSQRISGAGAIVGLTEANILGIGAAFTSVGTPIAAGATSVQNVLIEIDKAVNTSGEHLETFANTAGMSATVFSEAWEDDAASAFTQFVEGLGTAGGDAIGLLEELGLADSRVMRSFLSLAGAGDLLSEAITTSNNAWEENTALATEAGIRYGTTESKIAIFLNTLKDIGVTIGDAMLPFLNEQLDKLTKVLGAMSEPLEYVQRAFGLLADGDTAGFFAELDTALIQFMVNLGMPREKILEISAAFQGLTDWIQNAIAVIRDIVDAIMAFLEPIITAISSFVSWKDVLIALGIVIAAIVLPIIWSLIVAMAPVVLAIAAVIAVVALLRNVWENDWLGIRTALTAFWEETGRPLFEQLQEWLAVNIPVAIETIKAFWTDVLLPALKTFWGWIESTVFPLFITLWEWLGVAIPAAIETLKAFWTDTLLPALKTFWAWIVDTLVPMFITLWDWLGVAIPAAIETLKSFWENTLLPALKTFWGWIVGTLVPMFITLWEWLEVAIPAAIETLRGWWEDVLLPALEAVWDFLSVYVIPLWEALAELFDGALTLAITALQGLWENVLLPALEDIWEYIEENLLPIFEDIAEYLVDTFGPNIEDAKEWVEDLEGAFDKIGNAINTVIGWIKTLTTKLKNLTLPDFLVRGSPTPFEISLVGIGEAMKKISSIELPRLAVGLSGLDQSSPMQSMNAAAMAAGNTTNNNYNLNANYAAQSERSLRDDIRLLQMMSA